MYHQQARTSVLEMQMDQVLTAPSTSFDQSLLGHDGGGHPYFFTLGLREEGILWWITNASVEQFACSASLVCDGLAMSTT